MMSYTPKLKKNANTLRFTLPGFKHTIDVPFPGRCLPVCERCKKNFKTREHCRTRDCHLALPWSDTYLCITLDPSCTAEDGTLLDGPFQVKATPAQPYSLVGEIDPLTPICAPCKDKNYTRTYCRSNKKHRQLPWSTVYVLLTYRPEEYPGEYETANPSPAPPKRRKLNTEDSANKGTSTAEGKEDASDDKKDGADTKEDTATTKDDTTSKEKTETKGDKEPVDGEEAARLMAKQHAEQAEKFNEIPRSRTFMVTISATKVKVDWLDFDSTNQGMFLRNKNEIQPTMPPEEPMYGGSPYGGYPDPRRDMMRGRFPPPYGGPPDMYGGHHHMGYDGGPHHGMSPRMPYGGGGGFPQEMMDGYGGGGNGGGGPPNSSGGGRGSGGRHGDAPPQSQMPPFDGPHNMMRGMGPWGFPQHGDMYDRMHRGGPGGGGMPPGPDMYHQNMPPMWGGFMRGPHPGSDRYGYGPPMGGHHPGAEMDGYGGPPGGYPPHMPPDEDRYGESGNGSGPSPGGDGMGPPQNQPNDDSGKIQI